MIAFFTVVMSESYGDHRAAESGPSRPRSRTFALGQPPESVSGASRSCPGRSPDSVGCVDSTASLDELSAAVLAVAARRSVRDVLQTIVTTARNLLDCDYAALGVPDDLGGM